MLFSKNTLLNELLDRVDLIRNTAGAYVSMDDAVLIRKPDHQQWSISEIFIHLTITDGIYIRYIIREISKAKPDQSEMFKSGWLGTIVYNKILPGENGKISKLRTPAFLRPKASVSEPNEVFNNYFEQLDTLEQLMIKARKYNIDKIRIPFSFTSMLHLKLGDIFRFMVAHHERHLIQASRMERLFQNNGA